MVSRESINKQPLTTHLSVNTQANQSTLIRFLQSGGRVRSQPYFKSVGAVRSINCCGQPEVFSPFSLLSLLFSPLHGSSLRKPLAPRVHKQILTFLNNSIPNVLVSVWHLFVDMDAWTVEEDDILLSSNKKAIMELKKKRGGAEVMERIHFLEEIK